ncbi:MAG: TlpA family protein disulfide reductase [Actinomycetota bacterium]|nr:TlpA family protein disulfide reductase [Actinomycetota bacterium]
MITKALLPGVLAVALLGAACTRGSAPPATSETVILASPSALNATRAPLLPTDRFALPQLDQGQFQALLRQLRGTPTVVNIWASWCGPCRKEAPHLAAAARRFGHRVQFLGIDIQDQRTPAQEFIRDFGWPYPSIFDPTSEIQHGLGLLGQPVTLFFDRQGNRVKTYTGPVPAAVLDQVIGQLLA